MFFTVWVMFSFISAFLYSLHLENKDLYKYLRHFHGRHHPIINYLEDLYETRSFMQIPLYRELTNQKDNTNSLKFVRQSICCPMHIFR